MTNGPIQPVARNLKRRRLQRGLSLSALADEAQLSKSTLSELERGRGNPSLDTIWQLAQALHIPFAELFEDNDPGATVRRLEEAPVISNEDGLTERHLESPRLRGHVEVYVLDLAVGADRVSVPHMPGLVEHVVVMSGVADVGPDGTEETLAPGDYIRFAADQAHRYRALDGPAVLLALHEYAR